MSLICIAAFPWAHRLWCSPTANPPERARRDYLQINKVEPAELRPPADRKRSPSLRGVSLKKIDKRKAGEKTLHEQRQGGSFKITKCIQHKSARGGISTSSMKQRVG